VVLYLEAGFKLRDAARKSLAALPHPTFCKKTTVQIIAISPTEEHWAVSNCPQKKVYAVMTPDADTPRLLPVETIPE
jgi:hypothetical protein